VLKNLLASIFGVPLVALLIIYIASYAGCSY
jgi:hypothetical protein